jgi:hypothetical protein
MSFKVVTAGAILATSVVAWYAINRSRVKYPPGPKPELFFGNARQLPTSLQWLRFAEWPGKTSLTKEIKAWLTITVQIDGLVFFKVFHLPYLVINDGQICLELLDKRSNIYSDRPRNTMAKDL